MRYRPVEAGPRLRAKPVTLAASAIGETPLEWNQIAIITDNDIEVRSYETALTRSAIDHRAAGWYSRPRLVVAWERDQWLLVSAPNERSAWAKVLGVFTTAEDAIHVAMARLALGYRP